MAALDGRHALVTGGGRGIGRAVAAALAREGAIVTVLGRREGQLADAVAQRHAASYVVADVTDARAMAEGIEQARRRRGAIDILIANAGGVETSPFANADAEQFRRMFEVNVMGVVHAARAVLAGMAETGFGRIIAIASTAGLKGYAYVSAYCAAKHAVIGLVRSLALETAKCGITVNAVCPGYTRTDLLRESVEKIAAKTGRSREEALAAIIKEAPLGRVIEPEEVAAAVLFLCSPHAGAITGATIAVAGGEV
jgi:3-hydroxybutyrate dehydrogenase